jgi:hypothetical protein
MFLAALTLSGGAFAAKATTPPRKPPKVRVQAPKKPRPSKKLKQLLDMLDRVKVRFIALDRVG